jgi:hypothetical protein
MATLEDRLVALEAEVARIKERMGEITTVGRGGTLCEPV